MKCWKNDGQAQQRHESRGSTATLTGAHDRMTRFIQFSELQEMIIIPADKTVVYFSRFNLNFFSISHFPSVSVSGWRSLVLLFSSSHIPLSLFSPVTPSLLCPITVERLAWPTRVHLRTRPGLNYFVSRTSWIASTHTDWKAKTTFPDRRRGGSRMPLQYRSSFGNFAARSMRNYAKCVIEVC